MILKFCVFFIFVRNRFWILFFLVYFWINIVGKYLYLIFFFVFVFLVKVKVNIIFLGIYRENSDVISKSFFYYIEKIRIFFKYL